MNKSIIIPDSQELERLKKKISQDGTENLHVIADFDRTLTKAFVNEKEFPSLISVLRDGTYLTSDYAQKAHALFDKYHPIEIDSTINLDQKKKAMFKWWTSHFKLLINSGLNKRDLESVVSSGKAQFRKGVLEFLDFLHSNNIPLVIMSSNGLGGDSISMYLQQHRRLYGNVYIISNSYEWDEHGNAIGIKKPIIHCMNKDETAIPQEILDKIKQRRNVILLGDNLEDVGMVSGFDYKDLIKIGFLNNHVNENLPHYKKSFDVILLNDASFDYINGLLKEIVK